MSAETLTITGLGPAGDGIVHGESGPVHVPFALPGETVSIARVKNQGTIMALTAASPSRTVPPCRHFGPDGDGGSCGGCSLQHMGTELYQSFKRDLVVSALSARGIETEIAPLQTVAPGSRRRVVFAARRTEKGLLIGFNQAQSHHIVAICECPIALPGIVARLDDLKAIGLALADSADAFRLAVIDTPSGLDIAAEGLKRIDERQRRAVTEVVLAMRGIARVAANGETLIEPVKPQLDFGGAVVTPPPGGFVQAVASAETAMAQLVTAHVGKAKRIADLFAGCGTFSLRLARQGAVHAVEADAAAIAALDRAARASQGLKPVTVERRDLFRRPLTPAELKVYDAVVFDPPRAGAEAQVAELARSTVKRVAAVSCNPLTLARDLALLAKGGYRIERVVPIDQFLWSPHIEAVAMLTR